MSLRALDAEEREQERGQIIQEITPQNSYKDKSERGEEIKDGMLEKEIRRKQIKVSEFREANSCGGPGLRTNKEG